MIMKENKHLNILANKIRTNLLLTTASEIKKFKKLKMKINSISPENLYKFYSDIEIYIEKRIFSTTQRKNSQLVLEKNTLEKITFESDYSPILEGIKINKVLVSSKKNQKFLEQIQKEKEKENLKEHKSSQDTNDTSFSSQQIEKDDINKDHKSIKYLRKIAKLLINRKRKKKHASSFYQNRFYKSQANLHALEKNSLKNSILNKNNKNIINENYEENIIENKPIIYSSGLFCFCDHKGVSFSKNNNSLSTSSLICENHISKIKYNDYSNNNSKGNLTNIPYEYEELIAKKINKIN